MTVVMNFMAIWWVSYVVFGVTALLGGLLAVHSPAKEETRVRWVYGIGFVLLFLLGLLVTKAQHDDSIKQVADAATKAQQNEGAAITKAVTNAVQPYQSTINDQKKEIADLQKETHQISTSNIVTGKKPISVQVQPDPAPKGDPTLRVTGEDLVSTRRDAPYKTHITVQFPQVMSSLNLYVACNHKLVDGKRLGPEGNTSYVMVEEYIVDSENAYVFRYASATPPIGPSRPVVVDLWSVEPIKCSADLK